MFKCLLVKTVKRLHDCSGLYRYLLHQTNRSILQAVGLGYPQFELERLPHLKLYNAGLANAGQLSSTSIIAKLIFGIIGGGLVE